MNVNDMDMLSFYSDPLAAAWMADKFGFRFGDQRTAYPIPFCHDVIDEDRLNGRPEKYYVHADSMHLLKRWLDLRSLEDDLSLTRKE